MRGHDKIIALRKQRRIPEIVFLNDFPCELPKEWFDVCVHNDSITNLDLRFLIGLNVSITGTDEKRVKALYQKAVDNKPKLVVASVVDPTKPSWKQTGWMERYSA